MLTPEPLPNLMTCSQLVPLELLYLATCAMHSCCLCWTHMDNWDSFANNTPPVMSGRMESSTMLK